MTRLIDADALVDQLEREAADEWNRNTSTNWANAFCVFVDRLDESPAIDAAPVRRGEWKVTDAWPHKVYCANCYSTIGQSIVLGDVEAKCVPRPNFCPNCGADMRGPGNE